MNNTPKDMKLYESIKKKVYQQYVKPSAYRSGMLVKSYKEAFKNKYGPNVEPYEGNKKEGNLTRWFREEWQDIGNLDYPVYRPTKRINKKTPLTVKEIKPSNIIEQSILKQKIKGKKNLPPFKKK